MSRNAVMVVRRASIGTLVSAATVLPYLAFTWDDGHRPWMAFVAGLLLGGAPVLWALRRPPSRRAVVRLAPALTVLMLTDYAVLAYLDGGIASPLGVVPYAGMTLMATVVSRSWFRVYAVWTVALYLVVAWIGGPAPQGHAAVHTIAFVVLATICSRHAEALRSLRKRLAVIADVDALTGCLNRGAFDRRLDAELARAGRSGHPVTLVLLDLDGLKSVNDTHGHDAGDALLRWTGMTLRTAVRSHDVVGRIGGDEFAVILTGAAHDPAKVTERLRELLAPHSPASIGYAAARSGGDDADALRVRADERLYADKTHRGRTGGARASAPAVPDVASPTVAVSRFERRRHAVAQSGLLSAACFVVGAFYVLAFDVPTAGVVPMLVLNACGLLLGLGLALSSGRLARTPRMSRYLWVFMALEVGIGGTFIMLDGGVDSPVSLGLLATIPLVALSSPRRSATPLVGAMVGAYVAVAIVQGSDDPWRPAVMVLAFLCLAFGCGLHGRYAAVQRRRLTELSRRDALTGALNRRGFDEEFAAALSRTARTPAPLSLLMLDLDGFKEVNDTRGHAAGDDLLRWVGTQLCATLRAGDHVGRLGGDEFAVLLPDCDADDAAILARRLRELLGERTACSAGTATRGSDGDDQQALYLHADRELYAAKRDRRGRAPVRSGPVTHR